MCCQYRNGQTVIYGPNPNGWQRPAYLPMPDWALMQRVYQLEQELAQLKAALGLPEPLTELSFIEDETEHGKQPIPQPHP